MTQTKLDFPDGLIAQEVAHEVDRALAELVERLTAKEAAWRLGIAAPTLHKKLHREERNQISLREAVILIASAPTRLAREAIEPLVRAVGAELVDAKVLSPEEELRRLREALDEELGPAAKERLMRKVRSK